MLFRDIIGQESVKNRFIQSVINERISHAQLLTGPVGNGKLALAIAYARYIACIDKQAEDSCGKCASCLKFNKLIHPDLHFVFPVVKVRNLTKPVSDNFLKEWRETLQNSPYLDLNSWLNVMGAENQQAGIFAQESQEIIRKLNLKTYESEYKFMIIWLPEKMNENCSNKLLKMIEEPPSKTVFLLVADDISAILPTILSRTQMIKVPKIGAQNMLHYFKENGEKYGIQESQAENIVRLANGNFMKALNLIKTSDDYSQYFELFKQLMRYAFARNIPDMIKLNDSFAALGREKQKSFFTYSLNLLRENFILNQAKEERKNLVFLGGDELIFSEKFSSFITERNIFEIYEEFNKSFWHIERNGSAKMVFIDTALKLTRILNVSRN